MIGIEPKCAHIGGDACTSSARAHGVATCSPGAAPEQEERPGPELRQWDI